MASNPDQNISWETPPPGVERRKPSKWARVAEALKANPGKWARVVTQGNIAIKSDAENGRLVCFRPQGSFEGRVVNFSNRFVGDVYLRYIGENGEYKNVT